MGTIISTSGGVGGVSSAFKGFKYNVSVNLSGVQPVPTAGQAIVWYEYVNYGEFGGYEQRGTVIHNLDADGNYLYYIINKINDQPCIITDSTGAFKGYSVDVSATVTYPNQYFTLGPGINLPADPAYNNETILPGTFYFNFGTSQINTFTGTSMVSNFGGQTISQGTFYLGYGQNTPGTTDAGRAVPIRCRNIANNVTGSIYTAGVMTGTMTMRLMVNGAPAGVDSIIPAGSAAGGYAFYSLPNLGSSFFTVANGSSVSIRVIQTGATSCGINQYGWIILP
jgi:hypothetical protein